MTLDIENGCNKRLVYTRVSRINSICTVLRYIYISLRYIGRNSTSPDAPNVDDMVNFQAFRKRLSRSLSNMIFTCLFVDLFVCLFVYLYDIDICRVQPSP